MAPISQHWNLFFFFFILNFGGQTLCAWENLGLGVAAASGVFNALKVFYKCCKRPLRPAASIYESRTVNHCVNSLRLTNRTNLHEHKLLCWAIVNVIYTTRLHKSCSLGGLYNPHDPRQSISAVKSVPFQIAIKRPAVLQQLWRSCVSSQGHSLAIFVPPLLFTIYWQRHPLGTAGLIKSSFGMETGRPSVTS